MQAKWNMVSKPIQPGEPLPAERKVVLVWVRTSALPFCGYIRYAAGDLDCQYFVVYHGNADIGADVVAWCDCLPDNGPTIDGAKMYIEQQSTGRGFGPREGSIKIASEKSPSSVNRS